MSPYLMCFIHKACIFKYLNSLEKIDIYYHKLNISLLNTACNSTSQSIRVWISQHNVNMLCKYIFSQFNICGDDSLIGNIDFLGFHLL